MKTIKLIAVVTISVLALFSSVTYVSCNKSEPAGDPLCDSVKCENGGICKGGECQCPEGSYGTYCQNTWRKKMFGKWYISYNYMDGSEEVTTYSSYSLVYAGYDSVTSLTIFGFFDPEYRVMWDLQSETELKLRDHQSLVSSYGYKTIFKSGTLKFEDSSGFYLLKGTVDAHVSWDGRETDNTYSIRMGRY